MSSSAARRVVALLLAALLSACAALAPVPSRPVVPADAERAIAAWARVLDRFVNERGEVDFAALARDRADLDAYLAHVARMPLDALPEGPVRLAHMINAYNALSMANVIDSGIPATHAGWNKVRFFLLRRFDIGGSTMSLYTFENRVIRPYTRRIGEARVHFALNCSAVSCPVLPRRPFDAATLDVQLERETRAFFARPENFRIDAAQRVVVLSELLAFYPEDFVPPAAHLIDYANRYAPERVPDDFGLRFSPYDWTIANSRRAR